jgi:hypothetical protein
VRRALVLWALAVVVLLVAAPAQLARQTITGRGPAMLLLAALEIPRRWLPWSTLAVVPTSAFLVWRVLHPWPDVFAPEPYFEATRALASACAERDLAVAPTDLSLMIAGLTPCSVAFGHRTLTPDYERRLAEGNRFYHDPATTPAWRIQYLDGLHARFVLLPRGGERMLPPGAPYVAKLKTQMLEIWERQRDPS